MHLKFFALFNTLLRGELSSQPPDLALKPPGFGQRTTSSKKKKKMKNNFHLPACVGASLNLHSV